MGGGGGGGGGGSGLSYDEVGLSREGLAAKRDFAGMSRSTGEQPACVVAEFEGDILGEDADFLIVNTAEVGRSDTLKGNSLATRRCGRVGCSVECELVIDPANQIIDAAIIRSAGEAACRARS